MMMLMKEREILTRGPGRGMPRRARVRDLVSGARAWLARSAALAALLLTVSAGALAQKHHSFQHVFTPNQRTLQNQGANRVETKDEHGIITEPGEGTVKFYTVTGCGTDYGTTISLSGTTTIVESDDGSVYIQDIIATYKTGAWVKGTKSGNTITVPAKQRLYYSSNYDATVSLRWSKRSGTNVIPADETAENFTFTVDETAKTISLNGTSSSVMMSAFWDDDDTWEGYSVWETVYYCGVVDIFLEPKDITDGDITKALNDSIASLGENYIVNNLTINLAAGEAYTMSGTLTAGGNFTLTGNKENPATITMADDMTDNFITLDGTIDFAQKPDNTYSDHKFIGSVDINGVKIFGLRGALIKDAQKTLLEELTISNSVIQMPASNKNVIDFNGMGYVGKVIVENSTIWAADKNAGFFAQYGSRPKNISSDWLQEFKFMNSTFVNIANSKNFNDLKQNGTAQNVYTVKNCIFVDCGKEGKVVIGINKSQQSDTPYWDVDGNVFNFNGADTSGQEVTAAGQQNNEDIVKNSLAGVVAFKDAANGDFNVVFRPAEGVTVPATLPGDPRWTFGTAANEPNTYTVSVKTGTVDADKWKAKAGDGTLQALPLEGVADGEKVTLQYEGRKRVMSVRATKKAAGPALGDLYYSDGTWSSTRVAGKTPIGVIAYLGTDAFTETGTNVGGSTFTGHGLVLCLKNAASGVKWSTETGAYEFGEGARVNSLDALKRTTDVSGYTNTTTLAAKDDAATKYPAAWKAKNYTGLAAPAGTTGWFLPSAQQWVKMMEGLGGLAEGDIKWLSWFDNDHTAADKWETAMAKAGTKGTAYDSVTDDYLIYWSSSEYSANYAVNLIVNATDTGAFYGFYWCYYYKDSSDSNYRVRPVLAF